MRFLGKSSIFGSLVFAPVLGALAQVNITMWQVDKQHTGQNLQETILTPALVSSPGHFGLLFSQPLDGQSYSQPLYVSGLNIGGVTHNVIYLTTQHNSVYAFDADSDVGPNATPIWHQSLLPAGTTPIPQSDTGTGDISPEIGITATPVIDLAGQTLYTVSKIKVTANSTYQQWLHALDLKTGAEKFGGPVAINPTFAGSGPDAVNGVIPFNPLREHNRAALALHDGIVYITYASHGDAQPYHGEILGYNATSLQLVKTFIATPNTTGSGIWQGGASPAFDAAGNMYVATGNGPFDQNTSPYTTGTDWGQAILKLPTTGPFTVSFSNPLDWFVPNNVETLNFGDLDLGASGTLLLPDQEGPHPHLLLEGGKGGILYVIDRDNMGGMNSPNNSVQEINETNGLFVTPAYFNGSIYYTPAWGHLTQRTVGYNPLDGSYISAAANRSNFTYDAGGLGSWVFVSANGNTNGIVWTVHRSTPAQLHAYNAANVSGDPIYAGVATLPGEIDCTGMKFGLPMVANGKVYFTTYDTKNNGNVGHLVVFGVPPSTVGIPAAPSNVVITPVSSSKIVISWADNSSDELGFTVKRSTTPDGTFVALGPNTNANATSFVDTTADPLTTYYYQVVAFNSNGNSTPASIVSGVSFPPYAPPGLVARWDFEEGTSVTARDVTGHGFDGTILGEATRSSGGYIGSAIDFHGTGAVASRVVVPDAAALRFGLAKSFTLSAWVRPSGLRSVDEAVLAKSRGEGSYYGVWIDAQNRWVFRGPGGDIVGTAATTGQWTHLAAVQDGAAGTRSLYVNGALVGTGAAQAADGAGELWIGQASAPGSGAAIDSFPGLVDEVELYDRAFSAGQISSLLAPPILQAEVSLDHGSAGPRINVIWPAKTPVVEARKGAVSGQYRIRLHFPTAVSSLAASLQRTDGGVLAGGVSSLDYDSTGMIVTVTLNGVGNLQPLNLHLTGLAPGGGTADVPFQILWGDVDQDHLVSRIDLAGVARKHANYVNDTNAFWDLDGNGVVDGNDDAIVTANLGHHIGLQTDTNLSVGGTASASSIESGSSNVPAGAIDDIWYTRWASLSSDPQWITVDLGETFLIHAARLEWENAAGATYQIQVSDDNSHWTTVWSELNNTGAGIKAYTGANALGRYVRVYGTTRTTPYGYSLWDIQITGVYPLLQPPTITSAATKGGNIGTALTYQITATGSPTSYDATPLPAGLTINKSTGLISGLPSVAGNTSVTLSATNANGSGTMPLAMIIGSPLAPPAISSATTQAGSAGTALSYQITATGDPTSFSATGLPPGLSLNAATGIISGVPETAGTTKATIKATNASGTGSTYLTFAIALGPETNLSVGRAVAASYFETGNPVEYGNDTDTQNTRWASGLGTFPQWWRVDLGANKILSRVDLRWYNFATRAYQYKVETSQDDVTYQTILDRTSNTVSGDSPGSITGTGRFVRITVTGSSTGGFASFWDCSIYGTPAPPVPQITSPLTAAGTAGSAFSYQIAASNGPTKYQATGLPGGLSLDPATGVISGIPTLAATTNIALSATNDGGTGATSTLALTVSPAAGSVLLSAVSRQTHGPAGNLDRVLPTGVPATETRAGTIAGNYNLVLTFSAPVSGVAASLQLQTGQAGAVVGAAGAVSYSGDGSVVVVPLVNVGNAQRLRLHLTGIQLGNGIVDIPFNVLAGDVNGDGTVNVLDMGLVKTHAGQAVDQGTMSYDINANGVIDATDQTATRSRSGATLPQP